MTAVPLPGAATSGAFLFRLRRMPSIPCARRKCAGRTGASDRPTIHALPSRADPAPRGIFFLPVFFLIDRSPRPRHSAVCKRYARPRISSRRRSSPAKTIGGNAGLDAQRTTESPVALTVMRRSTVTPSICTA